MSATTAIPTSPEFDEDGLLTNPESWNEDLAREIARRCDVGPPTAEHWEVIHALREQYAQRGVTPAMSQVCRRHHKDPRWVHELFHTRLNAWRVAGLPNPAKKRRAT